MAVDTAPSTAGTIKITVPATAAGYDNGQRWRPIDQWVMTVAAE